MKASHRPWEAKSKNWTPLAEIFIFSQFFLKENVRYPVWTCRDPIFSDSRKPLIVFPDSWDPIFNSKDPNGVPKTP